MTTARLTLFGLVALLVARPAEAQFTYTAPGSLERPGGGSLRVGAGRVDDRVYAPGMRFPIENAPAYANSQIYGHGGYMGPGGGQCDANNYAYPWHDNYCEERSWTMPMCAGGTGHQGQDIRPATCADQAHWAVATVAGQITNIGTYSVYLTGDDGVRYDYLHMRGVVVSLGQRVTRGQRLGRVSNNMGSTPTTIHLHFNIRMNVSGYGNVYAPTYMSLIHSYQELVGPPDWSASYVDQTFPLASRPFELHPGETSDGYIELRNTGGQPWTPGQTFLGTTQPRDVSSPLAHASWVGPNRAATVDRVVAPGGTGRFAFTVRAPDAPGDYPQYFNLVQEGVAWFSDSGVPPDDQLQVRLTVVPHPDADGDGHHAGVDCDDASGSVHPSASEVCGDGVDQDCSGADTPCATPVDAGAPMPTDAGASTPTDAGRPIERDAAPPIRVDAGTTTPIGPDDVALVGSCGCRAVGARSSGTGAYALLALLALALRRRA